MSVKIEVTGADISRPSERPPKTNWKIELIKKSLKVIQHISPLKSAKVIWHFFTLPGSVRFSIPQQEFMKKAKTLQSHYQGDTIKSYQWGSSSRKVLLCHGWRSKIADFRRMTEALVDAGFQVEGVDMRAHGNSDGKHTAAPEFRDMIKNHITKHGPYEIVIAHSLGAIAAGIALSELGKAFQPKHFFVIAAPPYIRYFFYDIVKEVGFSDSVYREMCGLVKTTYHQSVDYFDLRIKARDLKAIDTHLLYCEDDTIIPFMKGEELHEAWSHATFVHIKGLGHYKIIAHEAIIDYILKSTK